MIKIIITSVGNSNFVISFKIAILAQNIVNGGTPLMLAVLTATYTIEFSSFLFFFLCDFTIISILISAEEYRETIVNVSFADAMILIKNHPLFVSEDSPSIPFTEVVDFKFCRGIITIIKHIIVSILHEFFDSFRVDIITIGRIFCQVIMINRDLFFNLISDKIFINHMCIGHPAIFIIRDEIIIISHLVDFSCNEDNNNTMDPNICDTK